MDKLKKLMKKDKATKVIFALGIIGIILVYISTLNIGKQPNEKTASDVNSTVNYAESAEKKIKKIVSRITGEKNIEVMVSLDSTEKTVYADAVNQDKNKTTDNQSDAKYKSEEKDNTEQEYVIVKDAEGNEKPLVVTTISPAVKGVVVVTSYAVNDEVSEKIVSAITTALNISSKKVCVVAAS